MTPTNLIEKVEMFQIYENYQQSFPCTHLCKIVLTDGQQLKKSIVGPDIYILIQAIAKEKICFKRSHDKDDVSLFEPQTVAHFDEYAETPYDMFTGDPSIKTPSANELLSVIFRDHFKYI